MVAQDTDDILREVTEKEYAYGFVTDIESEKAAKGLNETSCASSAPRRTAGGCWSGARGLLHLPRWRSRNGRMHYPKIDYQNAYYQRAQEERSSTAWTRPIPNW